MSIELVQGQAPEQTAQVEPQQTQQVQQTQPVQNVPLTPQSFQAPVVETPQTFQQPVAQVPANVATKDDLAVLVSQLGSVTQTLEEQRFAQALDRFNAKNADSAKYGGEVLNILAENPGLWQTGYENALEFAYTMAKAKAQTAEVQTLTQNSQQANAQIEATKGSIQATSNTQTNTTPAGQQQQEEDYGMKLVRLSQGSSLF